MKRQYWILGWGLLLPLVLSAQAPADTTLQIRNIDVQGFRLSGLADQGSRKFLQVDNNLSSLTSTTSEAFRQIPSVMTEVPLARHSSMPIWGCISVGKPG